MTRTAVRSALLSCLLLLALPAAADCPSTRGDIAPGTLDPGADPPLWFIQGDEALGVGDVIALLRAAVRLQDLRYNSPGPSCPSVPGDFSPGVLDESTDPPTWRQDGDGVLSVGDVIALQRAVVRLQTLGAGVRECVHDVQADWVGLPPRILTDRRCPVGISGEVEIFIDPFDQLSEEGFQIDRYTVTYAKLNGDSEPGVDVPQPIDATLFLDPGVPPYRQTERLSVLDEAAKFLPPLNTDFYYASGRVTIDATITVYGRSLERPDAICLVSFPHRFQIEDSGAATDPETDPDCIAETEAEGL